MRANMSNNITIGDQLFSTLPTRWQQPICTLNFPLFYSTPHIVSLFFFYFCTRKKRTPSPSSKRNDSDCIMDVLCMSIMVCMYNSARALYTAIRSLSLSHFFFVLLFWFWIACFVIYQACQMKCLKYFSITFEITMHTSKSDIQEPKDNRTIYLIYFIILIKT